MRDYQLRTLDAVRNVLAEFPSVLATAPTGAGKTVMFSEIIRRALLRDLRCDIVVHREELLVQAARTVRAQTSLTPGIVWRSYQQWDRPVRVIAHGSRLNREQLPTEAAGRIFWCWTKPTTRRLPVGGTASTCCNPAG